MSPTKKKLSSVKIIWLSWGDDMQIGDFDPCPFCGGRRMRWVALPGGKRSVGCTDCRALGPPANRPQEAIDLWNADEQDDE